MKRAIGVVLQVTLLVGLTTAVIGTAPASASPHPLDPCAGANTVFPGNDDGSVGPVNMGFSLDFFSVSSSTVYVNNNGNLTFTTANGAYTPGAISGASQPIIAPFWADVDTRAGNTVTYGTTTFNTHPAFCATWNGVGYYSTHTSPLNKFQVILSDRSDVGAGDFDIIFNYNTIGWETGDADGGSGGLGGSSARAGYSEGSGGSSLEFPGSGINGGFLDSNATTGLAHASNIGIPGQFSYAVRNGTPVPATHVSIETSANGLGGHLNAQNVTAGSSVAGYAIERDASNNFVANVAGTWSLTNKTGGILNTDLVPAGDSRSATFTGHAAGTARVHLVDTSSFTDDSGTLTVTPSALASITISPSTSSISAGGSRTYAATGFDSHGNSLGDVTGDTTFSIAPDGSCSGASCGSNTAGPHTVTGTDGEASDNASLQVNAGGLASIVISPSTSSISAGGSRTYAATGFDSHGNSLGDVTGDTTFSIAPDGSCSGASCGSNTAGPHTVTGTDGEASDNASLQVNAGGLASITISPSTSSISAGGSRTYAATGFDSHGNTLGDVTGDTTFSIAPDGSCSGASCGSNTAGPHTVTGTDGSASDNASLQVNAGGLASITISPSTSSISAGGSRTYTATGFDSHGNSLGDVTGDTTFSIAPDGSCSGASCGSTIAGPHTVTGTDGSASDTASLQVNTGGLASIVISPSTSSISAGGSRTYTAEGFDSHSNSLGDVTGDTTFTIAPDGSCSGASCGSNTAGPHTVTGTDGSASDNASLQVNAGGLASIVISPSTSSISAGGLPDLHGHGLRLPRQLTR